MKNVMVTLDDEPYRNVCVKADEPGRSISELVQHDQSELGRTETEFQRSERLERDARTSIPPGFRAADNLPRGQLYERAA